MQLIYQHPHVPHEGSEDAVSSRMPTRHQSVSPGARYLETAGGTRIPDLPSVLETSEFNALFKEATESSLKISQLTHDQKKKKIKFLLQAKYRKGPSI